MDETTTGMTRTSLPVVAVLGVLSAIAVYVSPGLGSVLASIHLAIVVGWSPAQALRAVVPSRTMRLALAVAMSLAISALAFQVLFWFGYAEPPYVVALATAYSLLLGWLMPNAGATSGWQVGGTA